MMTRKVALKLSKATSPANKLTAALGRMEASNITKNWLAFSQASQMYWVGGVFPNHIILRTSKDKAKPTVALAYNTKTTAPTLPEFKQEFVIHGSANPILITKKIATGRPSYFLGLIHARMQRREDDYSTYFYAFDSKPPFAVLGWSSRMWFQTQPVSDPFGNPLREHCGTPSAMATGLALLPGAKDLVVLYSSCDLYSRRVVMPLQEIEALCFKTSKRVDKHHSKTSIKPSTHRVSYQSSGLVHNKRPTKIRRNP